MTNSCIIGNKDKYLFILNIKWILKDQIIMQRVLLKSSHLPSINNCIIINAKGLQVKH